MSSGAASVRSAAAGAPAAPSPSFVGSVRGEVLKLSRQRALWALLGAGTLLLIVTGLALLSTGDLQDRYKASHEAFFTNTFSVLGGLFDTGSGIVLLISAARLFGMEYSGGTIRVLLARGLGRVQIYFAKLIALAVLGAVLFIGFAAIAGAMVAIAIQSWTGSIESLTALPAASAELLKVIVLVAWTSIGVTVLLGSTASIIGRSLSFGMAVAMGFFPADNFGTLILLILQRITHNDAIPKVSAYLLGPNLNTLVSVMEPALKLRPAFASPLVTVSAAHSWTVVAVYSALFLLASIALLLRRDVLE
jgi:ABC-type transport system involved in multi-copper enzyme maturation permease subunit